MGFKYENESVYFITYKTFAGRKYFIEDDDKKILVNQINKARKKFNLEIIAFVVLSNHYHMLLKCSNWKLLSKSWQIINGATSYLINNRHKIRRSIWGYKFNWAVKDEANFYKFLGYILGNPLKHGLVKTMEELRGYDFFNYKEVIMEHGQDYIDSLIVLGQKFDFEEPDGWRDVCNKVINSHDKPTKSGVELKKFLPHF
jgi:putative transposase